MKVLLDRAGLARLALISSAQYQDKRRYYAATDALAIIVARNNIALGVEIVNQIADAVTGADSGVRGFVFERNEGKLHSKMTIFRFLKQERYDFTLSQFLNKAPME